MKTINEVEILRRMEPQPNMDAHSGTYSYQAKKVTVIVSGYDLKRLKEECCCEADRIAQEAVIWIGVEEAESEMTVQLPKDLEPKRNAFVEHVRHGHGLVNKKPSA
jgi:hypothetical protein